MIAQTYRKPAHGWAPKPLDAAESWRVVLYDLVRRADAQAAAHRQGGDFAAAVECENDAQSAQAEIESLYLE